jgi:hypothetical protein
VAQIAGSVIQGNAAKSAAKAQAAASAQATAEARAVRAAAETRYAPDIDQAARANDIYSGLLGTGGDAAASAAARDAYLGSSNYNFVLGEANKGINASAYANGTSRTGAALKALATNNANVANGFQQQYMANLDRQVGYGAQAKAALSGADTTAMAAINNATQNTGAAAGNAAIAQGASWANTTNNIGTLLGGLIKDSQTKTTTSSYGGVR